MKTLIASFTLALIIVGNSYSNAQTVSLASEKPNSVSLNGGDKESKEHKKGKSTEVKSLDKKKKEKSSCETSSDSKKEDVSYLFITP